MTDIFRNTDGHRFLRDRLESSKGRRGFSLGRFAYRGGTEAGNPPVSASNKR